MDSAPWKIFQFEGKEILVDVDGGITMDGHKATPFPCEISHAAICDRGLVATWVDHELRLARMALLPLDEKIQDGVSKANLRLSRNTAMVASSDWCHVVDAEPLALAAHEDKIVFALYSRGMYCIDSSDNELWRLPLFQDDMKSPPRSNDVTEISIIEDEVLVWTRGGNYRRISLENGDILSEEQLNVECDLEEVFNHGERFLLSSKDGWAWEFVDGQITVARKLRGTIQDAVYDNDDWRVISWREDLMLRGESVKRPDLGVQLVKQDETWMVMDNQGHYSPHMLN